MHDEPGCPGDMIRNIFLEKYTKVIRRGIITLYKSFTLGPLNIPGRKSNVCVRDSVRTSKCLMLVWLINLY